MALLIEHHYVHHVLRMPAEVWPDPVNRAFKHINAAIYVPMQGPSELGASGKLVDWDRTADLARIAVPTLVVGAQYDTMDPKHMKGMADAVGHGRVPLLPQRQPHGAVRRSGGVLPRPDPVHPGRGRGSLLSNCGKCKLVGSGIEPMASCGSIRTTYTVASTPMTS